MAKTSVFAPGTVDVTLLESHDPNSFYQTRSGLWVSDGFRNLVVAKAQPTEAGTSFKLKPRPLSRDASDQEIEEELEEMLGKGQHLFTETQVSAIIARLISGQPKGESGPLLNNGFANLLYLLSCIVCVDWGSGGRRWHVFTWPRVDGRWRAGNLVFSPDN